MEGRIIPRNIAEELQGTFLDNDTCFHFIEDINDNYFIFTSPQYDQIIAQTQYKYLLNYPLTPFIPKPDPEMGI